MIEEETTLAEQIRALGPWFHNMRIGGIETAPEHFLGDYPSFKWRKFQHVLPDDLEGRSVLDIGCNAGFYSLEMKRRGAGEVVAIDSDPKYLRQARFAFDQAGADIELKQMSVYDIARLGRKFDLVLFLGVFYHLRHPLLALDLIHEHVAGDLLLFQSLQRGDPGTFEISENQPFSEQEIFEHPNYPKLFFVEERYADDPTNWFIPNRAAAEAMLRSSGFSVIEHPEEEVYLCRRAERYFAAEPPPRIA